MSSVIISGNTSGSVTLSAPDIAGTTTLTLPTTSGTIVTTSGAQTIEFADGSASTPSITNSGDTNTGIFFPAADTIAFAEGGAESMRIDSSGNVGIGTNSPATILDVRKDTSAGRTNITFTNGAAANTSNKLRLRLAPDVNFVGTDLQPYIESYVENASNDYSGLAFGTYNGSATERMRIDSSGNVLVGTTSVLNAGLITEVFNGASQNGIVLKTTYASTGSTYITFRNSAGNEAGYITQNGTTTVNYVTSSDYRLKENIKPITNALDKVAQLKPVTYTWKNTDNEAGEGFIAHELAEICPLAVSGEKDAVDAEGNPKYQGIDTSKLVATLTAAIQELKAELDAVKAELATIKGAA